MPDRMEDGLDISFDARTEQVKERGFLAELCDPCGQIVVHGPSQLWYARTQLGGDPGEVLHHLGGVMCGIVPVIGRP